MALTDQLCLGFTILTFLSYIAIDVVLQLQIPYNSIGLPQKGLICPNQYIKYTDSFDIQCVSDCNQKEITKKQSIHKHLAKNNQPNFIAYENQICLPTLDQKFYQLQPYVEKPIQMYISQSLKYDSLVIICIIFISLAIINGTLAFYRDYAEFIVKISQIVSMVLSFAIILILLRKYRSVQEANEFLISNDSQYDLSQMAAIMMLNKMDLVYLALMAFMSLLLGFLIINYSMDRLQFSVFPLTHWFTISYYKDYLNNEQMDQNEKPKKSSWPLILFQIINFILFYTINMSSLSISQESSQYAFGETSIVFNIVLPTLSFILYLYFAILISLISEYNLYQRQNTILPQIGKAGIQAAILIILFPLNFLRSFLQFFGKDKFSYLAFTTLRQGFELMREQNHNMNEQELGEVELRSKINLYDQLNKVTHIISVCLALACNFVMLILQQNIPAPFLISLLAYSISYTYYIPIVSSPLKYSFFEGQNEMDEHKQQNMKCLLRLLEQNQQ